MGARGGSTRTESISTLGDTNAPLSGWLWVNCKQLLCVSRKYTPSWTTRTQSCIDECLLAQCPQRKQFVLKWNLVQMEYQSVNDSITFITIYLDKRSSMRIPGPKRVHMHLIKILKINRSDTWKRRPSLMSHKLILFPEHSRNIPCPLFEIKWLQMDRINCNIVQYSFLFAFHYYSTIISN